MKTNFKDNQVGFGLIEVTISIYILIMGLLGIMSLLHQSQKAQYANENTLVAAQLAQEGIELVRNVRDNNWLDPGISDWRMDIIGGLGGDVEAFGQVVDGIDGFGKLIDAGIEGRADLLDEGAEIGG